MNAMVSNLLDMARLEAGAVPMRREWQPLEEVVGSALAACAPTLQGRRCQVGLADDLPLLHLDAVLFERVLVNLLENAAKYTPAGTPIRSQPRPRRRASSTSTTSARAPAGREDALFDSSSGGSKESATTGVGLGLAIARAIVQAHGGTIPRRQPIGANGIEERPLHDRTAARVAARGTTESAAVASQGPARTSSASRVLDAWRAARPWTRPQMDRKWTRARILVVGTGRHQRFARMALESEATGVRGRDSFRARLIEQPGGRIWSSSTWACRRRRRGPDPRPAQLVERTVIVLSAQRQKRTRSPPWTRARTTTGQALRRGELLARVRAQLRRRSLTSPSADPVLRFGSVSVDLTRRVVERRGEQLHLTPIEYRLLTHLGSQPDRGDPHQQLLKAIWGPGAPRTPTTRVHMANLRKKVEDDPSMPRHLLTEAGSATDFARDAGVPRPGVRRVQAC